MEHKAGYIKLLNPDIYGQEKWLCFQDPESIIAAHQIADVKPALQAASRAHAEGKWLAGYISYEAAPGINPTLTTHKAHMPLLWFGVYKEAPAQSSELEELELINNSMEWEPGTSREEFAKKVKRVKDYIAAGDSYQVNLTFKLRARLEGSPYQLFHRLVHSQPTPYAAYLNCGDWAVCSASPECFFSKAGTQLMMRPMKGTSHRGKTLEEDLALEQQLKGSEKDRAENVMIVDMVRNDLGQISLPGSVQTEVLYEIEKYQTVQQMTSTVWSQSTASLEEVFAGLFPCSSITGAPKKRTMEIIQELEDEPRGVYTGAVGYWAPNNRASFNVAIRSIAVNQQTNEAEYGIGAGIVWDSDPQKEYDECLIKSNPLRMLENKKFILIEALLHEKNKGLYLEEMHFKRMQNSAEYFDFIFDKTSWDEALSGLENMDSKIRLSLSKKGLFTVEQQAITSGTSVWAVTLAQEEVNSSNIYLYHKTNFRTVYDEALARAPGMDDVLLFNERGELTESCRANIVLQIDGVKYSPPVSSGLLNGIYRDKLISEGSIKEKVLYVKDLERAEQIHLINSVRKWISVEYAA